MSAHESWLPAAMAVAVGSVQVPPEQVPAQALPQDPQLLVLVSRLTHAPLHTVSPLGQLVPHEVPLHVALPPVGAVHATHDEPQLATDVLLMHVPLHEWKALGHAHAPLWQVMPPEHAVGFAVVLQPPQLAAWVMSVSQPFVALPSQSAKPVVHDATAQLLERHAAVACARLHALAQAPQLFVSLVVSTQVPLHSVGVLEEQPDTHS
jgi:hypothetical protein